MILNQNHIKPKSALTKYMAMRFFCASEGIRQAAPQKLPAGRKVRGTGCSNPPLLLLHKIHAKQKEQHPIRCCSWCDREDSNLWPSGSENCDMAI